MHSLRSWKSFIQRKTQNREVLFPQKQYVGSPEGVEVNIFLIMIKETQDRIIFLAVDFIFSRMRAQILVSDYNW
jgi:hypothetical protein